MDRRSFVKVGVTGVMGLWLEKIFPNVYTGAEKARVEKLVESFASELIVFPEDNKVPKLLRGYMDSFEEKSWEEVIERQREDLLSYLNSARYRGIALELLQKYFEAQNKLSYEEKSEEEIRKICEELIKNRIDKVRDLKVKEKELKKGLVGQCLPRRGRAKIDTIKLDNIPYVIGYKDDLSFEISQSEIFVITHEFYHATQFPKLMIQQSIKDVGYKLLGQSEDKYNSLGRNLLSEVFKSNLEEDTGLMSFYRYSDLPYMMIGDELLSFVTQIKGNLHAVSQYNKELVGFDMDTSEFAEDHYDFLQGNHKDMFSIIKNMKTKEENTTFSRLDDLVGKEVFINLMNRAI